MSGATNLKLLLISMLVFAGVIPHSPLLIPTIGKDNFDKLINTTEAIQKMAEQLYLSRPQTLIIISSHDIRHDNAFSMNLHEFYTTDFTEFGDLSISSQFSPDKELVANIMRLGIDTGIQVTLDSSQKLSYATSVPLELLANRLTDVRIVPISYSRLSPKEHVAFGGLLKEAIQNSNKRIAVIASGDLSHCHTSDAPGGFHPEAKTFDEEIKRAITELSKSTILNIKEDVKLAAKACIFEQLLILFGVLERIQLRPEILSYETPFGVGYLTAMFHL